MVTISRLRRWFAATAIAAVMIVAGAYVYARHRVQNALKQVPEKIGAGIQRSAQGYTYSQSDQGRTIFKIQAAKALFKLGGRAELKDVSITLYGRDAGRFDQIYGSDFEYDTQSGDVTANGKVQIDLEANPAGLTSPDQTPPKELKNPIHLETSGLVFNQKSGDAHTKDKVDFRISQASGSAIGVSYISKNNALVLDSQVEISLAGANAATVTATHGTITKDPRIVQLQGVHMQEGGKRGEADSAILYLTPDNALDHIVAAGNVRMALGGKQPTELRAEQLELVLGEDGNQLRTATFSGNVEMEETGGSSLKGSAGRVIASFAGKSIFNKVRAEQNVRLFQPQRTPAAASGSQTYELNAAAVDFWVAGGKQLSRAETFGPSQLRLRTVAPKGGETLISAAKFTAQFDALGQLASVHGAPEARIVNTNAGQPDRVSTSVAVDASFLPGQGLETAEQDGNVVFSDGDRKAHADHGRYTAANQMLELSGSPRVVDRSMATTANTLRLNRATGDGFAEGDVKSTYTDLKPQPGGALLASSSPIHVTAHAMTIHRDPAIALYTGDARLWQDANVVAAPSIEFDRNHRSVLASGSASEPVSTVVVQTGQHGRVIPTTITSGELTYVDSERKAHYTGGVTAKSTDFTLAAQEMDVFLQRPKQLASDQNSSDPIAQRGKLDHIAARGAVVITQPTRRATGDQLLYTAADDKFVLSGGPPSIFDAERGKITGVSLTLFRADDRVLVEGTDTSPSVTQTRVAR